MADGSRGALRVAAPDPEEKTTALPVAPPARPKRLRRILLALGPLVLIVVAGWLYFTGGRYVSTDDAYVQADTISVATDVSGMVAEVAVKDNQQVEQGQLLFRLDDEPYRIALAAAQAQLAATRNDIEASRAAYRQKLAELKQAQEDVAFYEREFARQSDLASRNVSSRAQYDQAQRNLAVAREKVTSIQQQAQQVLASLGGNVDLPTESQARYLDAKAKVDKAERDLRRTAVLADAKAKVDKAERDLRRTAVLAPRAGVVAKVTSLQPGEMLQAGTPAFTLVSNDVWIEANPKESELTHVRPGQPVTVTVDTYPGVEWHGTVASVSPATGAQFAVLPAQNASGNWVKVVQRIPIRIHVATTSDAPPLRAGMSANVEIDTGRRRTLGGLFDSLFGSRRVIS
jgi:membrane fusion protein (multidrug efflux system)